MEKPAASGRDLPPFCRTAFWVAAARDIESARPDALFRDPYVRDLAGDLGSAIRARRHRGSGSSLVVRTVVIDELIGSAIGRDGIDAVVNLACGLDTRAYRCDLPATLRWTDVDLPELIAYRRLRLAAHSTRCRYDAVAADLLDPDARRRVLERGLADSRRALVLTEGFLLYLREDQVAEIARDLAASPAVAAWIVTVSRRRRPRRSPADAASPDALRGTFDPAEGTRFFERFGFREREFHSTFDEATRLGRPPALARLRRIAGQLRSVDARERARRREGVACLEAVRTRGTPSR